LVAAWETAVRGGGIEFFAPESNLIILLEKFASEGQSEWAKPYSR
jgi:hypothetical protein